MSIVRECSTIRFWEIKEVKSGRSIVPRVTISLHEACISITVRPSFQLIGSRWNSFQTWTYWIMRIKPSWVRNSNLTNIGDGRVRAPALWNWNRSKFKKWENGVGNIGRAHRARKQTRKFDGITTESKTTFSFVSRDNSGGDENPVKLIDALVEPFVCLPSTAAMQRNRALSQQFRYVNRIGTPRVILPRRRCRTSGTIYTRCMYALYVRTILRHTPSTLAVISLRHRDALQQSSRVPYRSEK